MSDNCSVTLCLRVKKNFEKSPRIDADEDFENIFTRRCGGTELMFESFT